MIRLKNINTYIWLSTFFLICSYFFYNPVKANESNSEKIFYISKSGSISGNLFTDNDLFYPGKKLIYKF